MKSSSNEQKLVINVNIKGANIIGVKEVCKGCLKTSFIT
jgi:hypothetical protein